MELVIRDAQRAGDVISHARALVRKSDGALSLVDVDQLIRECSASSSPRCRSTGGGRGGAGRGLFPVLGDRVRLQQLS